MFSAEDLLAIAKKRFGEEILRNRMRGSVDDGSDQDRELLRISFSVLGRAEAALAANIGWPIPGVWPEGSMDEDGEDISGVGYADRWPYDLLQRALDLFNWRTFSGMERISDQSRRVGAGGERYFDELQRGIIGLTVGGPTDVGPGTVLTARRRDGTSNLGLVPDQENVLDAFRWGGWDWAHAGPGGF